MENNFNAVQKDNFAKLIGIEIIEAGEGKARGTLQIGEGHLNGVGIVHGGVIFTLADTVLAAASNSREGTAVAVNDSISFCKAARGGTLKAVAKEIALSRKLGTYAVEVLDEAENVIALFQGTVYRKQ